MSKSPKPIVFPYHAASESFFLFVKLLFVSIFAVGAFWLYQAGYVKGGDLESLYLAAFIGLCALLAFSRACSSAWNLLYSRSNRLVFTSTSVQKTWRGRTREYPYTQMKNLVLNYKSGKNTQYQQAAATFTVEFTDAEGRCVKLARNRTFGNPIDIYRLLQEKTGERDAFTMVADKKII